MAPLALAQAPPKLCNTCAGAGAAVNVIEGLLGTFVLHVAPQSMPAGLVTLPLPLTLTLTG